MIGDTAYESKPGGRRLGTIVGQRTAQDAGRRPVEQWEIRSERGVRFFMDKTGVRVGAPPPGGPTPGGPTPGGPTPGGPTPAQPPPSGGPPPGGGPPPKAEPVPEGEPMPGAPPQAPPVQPTAAGPEAIVPTTAGEPQAPTPVPVVKAATRLELKDAIAEELRRRRSIVPAAVTFVGVALCIVCGLLFGLGLQDKVGDVYGVSLAFAPGLLGLLVILLGTNLIDDQARRLRKLGAQMVHAARTRAEDAARERAEAEARERISVESPERAPVGGPEGGSEETQ